MLNKIIVSLVLLSTFVFAEEVKDIPTKSQKSTYVYIGYGIGSGSGNWDIEDTSGFTRTSELDTEETTIKIGLAVNSNRIEVSKNTLTFERPDGAWIPGSTTFEFTGYNLDWYRLYKLSTDDSINLYLNVGLGAYTGLDRYETEDQSAFAFNISAGVLFNLIDSLELEVAYRSRALAFEYVDQWADTATETYAFRTIYAGLNYKF